MRKVISSDCRQTQPSVLTMRFSSHAITYQLPPQAHHLIYLALQMRTPFFPLTVSLRMEAFQTSLGERKDYAVFPMELLFRELSKNKLYNFKKKKTRPIRLSPAGFQWVQIFDWTIETISKITRGDTQRSSHNGWDHKYDTHGLFQIDQGIKATANRHKHWLGWKWGVCVKLLDMDSM